MPVIEPLEMDALTSFRFFRSDTPKVAWQHSRPRSSPFTSHPHLQAAPSETTGTKDETEQARVAGSNGVANGVSRSQAGNGAVGNKSTSYNLSNGAGRYNGASGGTGSNGAASHTAGSVSQQLRPSDDPDTLQPTDISELDGYMDPCDAGSLATCASRCCSLHVEAGPNVPASLVSLHLVMEHHLPVHAEATSLLPSPAAWPQRTC